MKKIAIAFAIMLSFVSGAHAYAAEIILGSNPTASSTASSVTFTGNLQVGSVGVDVMALQTILNIELGANITVTGTFGSQTQTYLAQLQNKYPVEILIPDGLTKGNGIVDSNTITQLNILAVKDNIHLSNFTLPAAATTPATPQGPFQRVLQVGSTGDDVTLLRQILNSDPATQIKYPAGVSWTANVYDQEMADAVSRFQEKYASDVLTPAGLTTGTGSVGSLTLKKLNAIFLANNSTTNNNQTTNTSSSTASNPSSNNTGGSNSTGNTGSGGSNGLGCTQSTYTYGPWSTCTQGATSFATRTATLAYDCPFDYTLPLTQQSCDPTCTASTWAYSAWTSCSNGMQARTANKTVDCPNAPFDVPTEPLIQSCSSSDNNGGPGGGGGDSGDGLGDKIAGYMTGAANEMDAFGSGGMFSNSLLDKINTSEQSSPADPGGNLVQITKMALNGSAGGIQYALNDFQGAANDIQNGDWSDAGGKIWDGISGGFKKTMSDSWNQIKDNFNSTIQGSPIGMGAQAVGNYLGNQIGNNPVGNAVKKVVCLGGLFC